VTATTDLQRAEIGPNAVTQHGVQALVTRWSAAR